jgi:hypothetical protein
MFEVKPTADAGRCSTCASQRSGGTPARTGHGRYRLHEEAGPPRQAARRSQRSAIYVGLLDRILNRRGGADRRAMASTSAPAEPLPAIDVVLLRGSQRSMQTAVRSLV